MSHAVDLSIVMPAYREEENLVGLLPRLTAAAAGLTDSFEILVVDTVEPLDATKSVCAEHGATYVPRSPGNTYGDAVRTGIATSRGRSVIFMDADGSHPPEFLDKLFIRRNEADVVIASRYVAGGRTENNAVLIFMSRVLNVIYATVLGLRCKDVSNSFKLYDGELLRSISLVCQNFDVVEEILVRLRANRPALSFREVPFTFKERDHGETKRNLPVFIATYVVTIIRLWWFCRTTPTTAVERETAPPPRRAA